MRSFISLFLLIILLSASCKSIKSVFEKKTPHEKYADKLSKKDAEETPEAKEWIAVSQRALEDAQSIALPYRQNGYFHADKPHSLALKFQASFGERITFTVDKKAGNPFVIFADVFKQNRNLTQLLSADTTVNEFSFDADETATYLLRLQPKLYNKGEYKLSITVGPSLGFPVLGNKASVGSFWGASRDGGKRSHEGIDIFAPILTPVVAGDDGVVTGVKEENLGGKTVWIRVNNKNTFLYYAHLDKQLVQEGQTVKKGEVLGLVGNTGNAKHTASHLHFGVYTNSGAVNPLPFVDRNVKAAPAVPAKNLTAYLKLVKAHKTQEGILVPASTELVPLAANAKGYIAELPDGKIIQMPFASVKVLAQPIKPAAVPATNIAAR